MNGTGVGRDRVQAYAYLIIAMSLGDKALDDPLLEVRDMLEDMLSSAELAEAQRLARGFESQRHMDIR
jgi:TPR repeat protein